MPSSPAWPSANTQKTPLIGFLGFPRALAVLGTVLEEDPASRENPTGTMATPRALLGEVHEEHAVLPALEGNYTVATPNDRSGPSVGLVHAIKHLELLYEQKKCNRRWLDFFKTSGYPSIKGANETLYPASSTGDAVVEAKCEKINTAAPGCCQ